MGLKCIGIKTVCAAKALFQFWEEIFKVMNPANQIVGIENLCKLIKQENYGLYCLKAMFEVFVNNYPDKVVCDFMDDVILQILAFLRNDSIQWFYHALADVPQAVLNNGEKTSFITNLNEKEYETNKEYYIDFFDKFYRRCRTFNSKIY